MTINFPVTSEQIGITSVALTVVTFVLVSAYCKYKNISISLHELIVRSLAASALPTSLVILCCAIDTSLLTKLGGLLQVYIALAGLSLSYVSLVALFSPLSSQAAPMQETETHQDENDG